MRCLYCRRIIGPIRRLADREFCSAEHRRHMRSLSARVARESADFDGYNEAWPVYLSPIATGNSQRKHSSIGSGAVFGMLILLALAVGSMGLSTSSPDSAASMSSRIPFEGVRQAIRNHAAVRLNENFRSGFKSWTGVKSANDWHFDHGFVRPGRLRIWKESTALSDYQMEFEGQIERRSLGWAYRAKDLENYYATKITITREGPLPVADLVRYAVIKGRESARVSLPLPLAIRNDMLYRVQMNVSGESFTTSLNGRIVDTWNDRRIGSGGIGFFTDVSEVATIRWVTLSHRDDFVGRMLSYLGFFRPPLPL